MSSTIQKPARKGRKSIFKTGRTVSFKMDKANADRAQSIAFGRNIPFSMWMRQAAEEKMQREA
jgi:predicted transcriptional regulator